MRTLLIILFPALLITCNNPEEMTSGYEASSELRFANSISNIEEEESDEIYDINVKHSKNLPTQANRSVNQSHAIQKKIIKDGKIDIEVNELEKTKHSLDSILNVYNGYYSKEELKNSNLRTWYTLTIRIPSKNFDHVINHIDSGNGKVLSKEISARDVTDQFIDLETRLKNKREYLKRYSELLKKANTIEEILKIQEKIRRIEEEVESTTGRLKYLSDLVSYSTLRLDISELKVIESTPPITFITKIQQALSSGWNGILTAILFILGTWPIWIIAGIVWIVVKRRIR